jgi:ferredoxin-NADP reductase
VTTRSPWPGSSRPAGHLTLDDLPPIDDDATVYVCGSNGFADATTALVETAGIASARIRVERFGASS